MHKYEVLLLKELAKGSAHSVGELASRVKISKDSALWALESLSKQKYVEIERKSAESAVVTEEGLSYSDKGMPEELLLERLAEGHAPASELRSKEERIGMQWAKSKGWITIEKGIVAITDAGIAMLGKRSIESKILSELKENPENYAALREKFPKEMEELAKRKLLEAKKAEVITRIEITDIGRKAAESSEIEDEIGSVTRKMIIERGWEGKSFKSYDASIEVERAAISKRHPLKGIIDKIKEAYVGMGFREVRGPVIEPAFWVFDFLFVPQDHPARDKQDTFYLSEPETIEIEDRELIERVRKVHTASWKIDWSEKVASKAVLRTHTTSVSAHQIYQIVNDGKYSFPLKLFSVGRVFRNENIDYKHSTDFYQTDGIIVGKKLTLANLFDTITGIYAALGIKVKFKPSYFPFVEPGVEVDIFYEPKKEWLELGGAGIIRKEIIGNRDLDVLAWGLGVERILLAKDPSINSIMELYGSSAGWLRNRRVI
ncbi:MAG: phenylalanine--tRNA ligase subunit alpha [Candidatus Micrarchaeia archaeon]